MVGLSSRPGTLSDLPVVLGIKIVEEQLRDIFVQKEIFSGRGLLQ
jgi:hypothetical protein